MTDYLLRATAGGIRLFAAVTTGLTEEARRRHQLSPLATAALGRLMTGGLLLAAKLKTNEAITVRVQGDGPLGELVADAYGNGMVRGHVTHPLADLPLNEQGKLPVGAGVGQGQLFVTRFTNLKQPVTGTSPLVSGEIAEDITEYLYISEQTPSSVALGVRIQTDLQVEAAGGFFVEPMPEATDEEISKLEENLRKLPPVSTVLLQEEGAEKLLQALTEGLPLKIHDRQELQFSCPCSREKVEAMLISLGPEELASMEQEGKTEIVCHFCTEKYSFDSKALAELRLEAAGEGHGEDRGED